MTKHWFECKTKNKMRDREKSIREIAEENRQRKQREKQSEKWCEKVELISQWKIKREVDRESVMKIE